VLQKTPRFLLWRAAWLLAGYWIALRVPAWRRRLLRTPPPVRTARGTAPEAALILRAIDTAARQLPGSTCLVRALAGQALLGRYGHPATVHIGVAAAAESPGLNAHAWLDCDGEAPGGYRPLWSSRSR
jgi:hypothetical protein